MRWTGKHAWKCSGTDSERADGMKDFFSKYGWLCIEIITGSIAVAMLFGILSNDTILQSSLVQQSIGQTTISSPVHIEYEVPLVQEDDFVVDNAILELNSAFDWKDYVHVNASNGNDLIQYITVSGNVDTTHYGSYTLNFQLNWNGKSIEKQATYYVKE